MPESILASNPVGMPKDIPAKPEPAAFELPVAWLFGRQLIANLKWILLYAAFKGKLDPRDWMNPNVIDLRRSVDSKEPERSLEGGEDEQPDATDSEPEFWFDYLADSGDGQKAVYSIAYLCMSDLAAASDPRAGEQLEFVSHPGAAMHEGKTLLPRGEFLFVGGDTSYHISDYGNLAARFQNPFCWAAKDLFDSDAESVKGPRERLLLGIPGNHDYYDALDGFNRQFRRPSTGERPTQSPRQPLLGLPTFTRAQEASYLAVRLPFDWWFWGMDTEEGEIDFRQEEFFKGIQEQYCPKRLIVATPEPTTVFGKYAKEDESQSKTFAALGLERPFLKNPDQIGPGKCRVDLSGDVHHYARYWGPAEGQADASKYASVMSGGGGAFFHPSHTTIKEVEPEVIYPEEGESRKKLAGELFKFTNIKRGGYVWLFGFIIAFSIFFAATFPRSSKDAIDTFPPFIKFGISPPPSSQVSQPITSYVRQMPRNPWWTNPESVPAGYWWAMISLALSLILLGGAQYYGSKLFKKEYDPTWSTPKKVVTETQRIILWTLVFASFFALAGGILGFHAYDEFLTRFGRSLIVFAALVWSILAIVESVRYSARLFEEVYYGNLKAWHFWPVWVLNVMSALGFGASLWFFGKQESALLVSDLVLLLILFGVGVGLIVFACTTGANLKKGLGKFAFGLLGASHAFLQLLIPFLLVRKGHLLWAPLAVIILIIVSKFIGRALARFENGWPLAFAWIGFGAVLVATPFLLNASGNPHLVSAGALNIAAGRLSQFLLCAYAGTIGAVMSCVFFGWYLAVALAFNGHNNEAGGAARIEGFKEFIRFRLGRDGLTGYVIAIDEPKTEGGNGKLNPKIVDVFRVSESMAVSDL